MTCTYCYLYEKFTVNLDIKIYIEKKSFKLIKIATLFAIRDTNMKYLWDQAGMTLSGWSMIEWNRLIQLIKSDKVRNRTKSD